MILLSVDTCDARGSVAVLCDGIESAVAVHDSSEDYSSWLIPAAQSVLNKAGLRFKDVDVYAVATGPGSFTGLRVGLTTIKGLAEVYGRRIAPVPRLEALALVAIEQSEWVASFYDAQRGQVFGALFRREGDLLHQQSASCVARMEDFIGAVGCLAPAGNVVWVSPDLELIEDQSAWQERSKKGDLAHKASKVLAGFVGRMGYRWAREGRLVEAVELEANYVRRSDAEIFWKGTGKRASHSV